MAPQQSAGPFTAVVTGASGFVPGEVVKQLLSTGWNVSEVAVFRPARMRATTVDERESFFSGSRHSSVLVQQGEDCAPDQVERGTGHCCGPNERQCLACQQCLKRLD